MADYKAKPIYQLELYEYLNRDETKCLKCSAAGAEKIIKTTKYSVSSLVTHLKIHPAEERRYKELTASAKQQPITSFVINHVGRSTFFSMAIY